ncbi:MAG: hypothetical protein ABEI98_05510 [Halorhabdus sp.]
MTAPVDLVTRSLREETAVTFEARVDDQAAFLRDRLAAGDLASADFAIGLEMEVYAVRETDGDLQLRAVPDAVFDAAANLSKELGRHNVEVNTDPVPFQPGGFDSQRTDIANALSSAREALGQADDLVLDAMWTRSPAEGSKAYLTAHETRDEVTVATNMRADPRYVAIDNEVLQRVGGAVPLRVPGARRSFPTILFESLATSIQPHLQLPDVSAVPAYFNAAIRTLGPLLALSSNSPFLPPDLYDDGLDPERLVAATPHELRVPVFEQSVNHSDRPKVRVPDDIETTADVIDRVVADDRYAPFLAEWIDDEQQEDNFAAAFPEFEHKRGTYWRWVRAVIGGDPVPDAGDGRSIRIEYRPLPTQPTVRDVIALQALTVGLLRGLVAAEHPIQELAWETARENFYRAVADGLDAELAWIGADGHHLTDTEALFDDVFEHARIGLTRQGFDADRIEYLLAPFEARVETRTTPSQWKKTRVRERLSKGASLDTAIGAMQEEYVRKCRYSNSFATWY